MRMRTLLVFVGCLSLLIPACFATTLNFDNIGPQGTLVGASYIGEPGGPLFTNDTTVLTCPFYNCSGYPPESSPSVAYSPSSGLIDVVWTTGPVSGVSFYIDNPFFAGTVTEFGSGHTVLFSEALPNTTYGQPGVVVNLPATGVDELQIQGVANFYVIDDLSYTAGRVPEPASLLLLGTGLVSLGSLGRKWMKKS